MTFMTNTTNTAVTSNDPAQITEASVDRAIQLIAKGPEGSTCATDLARNPWEFDGGPAGYGPGTSMGAMIPSLSPRQGVLPTQYKTVTAANRHERIRAAKATLGDRVVILGHFYQRDEVVQHADFVGDSFQLATAAKNRPNAEAIVF